MLKQYINEGKEEISKKLTRYGGAVYEGIEGLRGEEKEDDIEDEILNWHTSRQEGLVRKVVDLIDEIQPEKPTVREHLSESYRIRAIENEAVWKALQDLKVKLLEELK